MSNIKIPSIAELLRGPYDPFSVLPKDSDQQGWNSDHPVFDELVKQTSPAVIIEVGTWKGRSAAHLARAGADRTELDEVSGTAIAAPSHVYCVDTWLGGFDHATSTKAIDDLQRDVFGSPRLYHQFLRNFADGEWAPLASRIHPFQNTSINGARFLAKHGVTAGLIYIDGSHEYDDVYGDLCAYYQLLAPGGVMFGDDFRAFPGVFAAVIRFRHEQDLKFEEVAGNYWILRRP